MFATSKALQGNLKTVFTTLVQTGCNQSKIGSIGPISNVNFLFSSQNSKNNTNNIVKNIGFGITHAKHVSQVLSDVQIENNLKKIQKTACVAHCFNPRTHQEEDVPIRIFRTNYTVTFLPSVQFLEAQFSQHKQTEKVYNAQKDSTLSIYKFNCKNCGHNETRSFPQNGFKYGTILTGCDQCHEVMLVSDHLGWVQPKKQKHSTDLIFSSKQVHDLIKRNLKKVGIDATKEKDLD